MTTHTITLARHTAQVVGLMGVLVLGTWDSYGTEQLLLRHGPEWEGLAIDATFHNVPNDEGVTVLADTDGLVTVPPEACMRASKYATITFRGVQDGVQRISCNLPYMVLDHAQVPGANSTATPSENAQALTQMQDLRDGAEAARDDAARSAELAQQAAAENQTNTETQAANAKASADTAAEQAAVARESAADAANSATAAQESETNAGLSATAAANAEAAAKQAQNASETAKADAETAKTAAGNSADAAANSAADAKKTLESIPADYSALSGKVDKNTSGISELKEDIDDLKNIKTCKNILIKGTTNIVDGEFVD